MAEHDLLSRVGSEIRLTTDLRFGFYFHINNLYNIICKDSKIEQGTRVYEGGIGPGNPKLLFALF